MAIVAPIRFTLGAELPARGLTVYAEDGTVPDLSSGWTFAFKIGVPGETALLTSGATVAGAATAPNVTFTPAAGCFDSLPVGQYTLQIVATNGASQRIWKFPFILEDAVR